MKKAKRALALALVFALVASFCVTGAAAVDPTPGDSDTYVQNGGAVTTEDGVTVRKTAKYVSKNKYEITLEVKVPGNVTVPGTDTDVVLVIDSSGSMGNSGMSDAKEAAADFAEELFKATGVNIRVAIVDYDDDATVVQVNGASWLTNSDQVERALDRIRDGGGTHIQGGIHEARELLASSDNKKVMIVISDGEPTYSFRSIGTGKCSHEDKWGLFGSYVEHELIVGSVELTGFDYNERVGDGNDYSLITDMGILGEFNSGYSNISVTCEDCEYVGTETFSYYENNGGPTIAEADIAKNAGIEIYSVYIGSLSGNAETTMEGIASGTDHCASTEGTSLSALLEEIAGSVTSTTAGAVTDPMGENIVLGDVSGLDGVTVSGNTLFWNPSNGESNPNGSTTYTVTYPITVDGEALTESDWLEANGRTTFSYRVNGEHKTVDFNVPLVWGEKVETEKEQNVYVFVKVTGSGDNGALTSDDEQRIEQMGLDSLNKDGWYTIGVTTAELPLASEATEEHNYYSQYGDAVSVNSLDHELPANKSFNEKDTSITWNELVVAYGANEYSEGSFENTDYYAPDENLCWHLNGVITLENLEKQFVDVTYYANGGTGNMDSQTVPKGSDVTLTANTFTYQGYTFTGWNTEADGGGEGYIDGDTVHGLEEDLTLYAQWAKNTNTAYKVEHYQEQLDGAFVLHETEELTGTTGDTATATPKSYTGFTFDEDNESNVTEGTIAGDGSLVLKLYYVRNTYTVTYTDGVEGEEVFADQVSSNIKYGAETPAFVGTPEREGYTFTGWEPEVAETVTETVTYEAQWEEITGTLTVTKTVMADEGTVTLPGDFKITVTGPNGYSKELTLNDADDGTTYTWTIPELSLGEYTVTEDNYAVDGYLCEGDGPETATISDADVETVTLNNSYTAISRELVVTKTVIKVGDTEVTDQSAIPEAKVGDTIIYKIVVTNNSNVALTGISVTDELAGQLYTDEDCETEATLPIESLEADGGSATFYAKYEVKESDAEAGSVTNTATAEAEDGTEGSDDVPVEVKKQYTLTVKYYYDEASGEPFKTEEYTLNEGDSWRVSTETGATHVAPGTVEDAEGIQFVLDTVLPITSLEGGIQKDEVVELVYARDEWEDGTPDYKQAWIVYEVADGQDEMGDVDPTSEVVTLEEVDGEYKKTVTADSTATPAAGNVFVNWTHEDNEVSSSAGLDYDFTAEGGRIYVFTAHFRAGTTSASVDKQLVSYERDGETVSEIPEGFKALVGDVLNYEISVKNTGEVALNDIAVSDTLWGNGVDSAMVGGTETDVSSGSCTVDVVVDGSVVITYSYTVTADDAGETITNTATVDLPGDGPDPDDDVTVEVDEYGITVTPADITIYMGGDEGYEAVVGENGQVISDNNTLPTPLFTVELSESFGELSVEQIEDITIAGTTSGEETRGWRFEHAGEAEDGTDLYYIVPDAGQEPIRVTYTDGEGIAAVSDHFDPTAIDELFAEFAIELYTGTVTSVTAEVNGITCEIDYSGKGKLTVRAVDDTDENPVVGVQEALPRPVEAGEGAVTAPAGTTYTLNETTVAADAAGVGLLFDGIIDDGADRTGALLAELESELGVTVEDGNYQAQYLDLVDAHNGNAWVKASGAVTVYWGYPEGTGEDTDFALYHFEGLHREGANSGFDIEDVATSDIERVTITKTANGIAFDISRGGFSPFVLVWDDGDGGDEPWWPPIDPGDDGDDGDDGGDGEFVPKWLNIDDHYAYIIGYEDGTVRPQGNITRAEVATIFFRLLTDEVRAEYWSTVSGYTDVKAGDWYNNAISTLSDLGIITGYEDGTFRPNASISRAEFVTIATRFFDYAAEYEGTFSDVSYSSWYADFVQAAVDMGLVNGYENGTFRPNASITRAEAVAIVNRVLLRRPDADHLLPWSVMNTFSDNVLESAWYYEDIQEATNSHDYEWLKSGVEDWTEKLPERDWAALEREWSKAYDAPGGEVTA